MKRYVLGIDAGTESVRAGVYDQTGRCVGFATAANANIHHKPGWAEQSVHAWEKALFEVIPAAIRTAGVDASAIEAVGVDGTSCTVVMLDEDGKPLRDAIMWMDIRSVAQAERVGAVRDRALEYVGYGKVSPEWFPCKVLWVKENEPNVYHRARTIFEHTDWLAYQLTGEVSANINTVSIRWFYNNRRGGYATSLYEKIGLADVFPKLPERVLELGARVGDVSAAVARRTGLRAGIPVAAGAADAFIGVAGVNALHPGQVALITGSSQLHIGLSDTELHAPGIFGSYPDAIIPGYHVVEAGQVSTGSVLKWFTSQFVGAEPAATAAQAGLSLYDYLNRVAADVPAGAEGLVVLEHWQGNRTPWVDAASRGVIRGLTLRHTVAHVYRAIMEGVAYGTAIILRRFAANGFAVQEMIASGGATNSQLWMQIHADVTGVPIVIPTEQQAVALGSAIAAAVTAGIYPSVKDAADRMVSRARIVEPHAAQTERYAAYVDQYERTYEALKDLSAELVQHG